MALERTIILIAVCEPLPVKRTQIAWASSMSYKRCPIRVGAILISPEHLLTDDVLVDAALSLFSQNVQGSGKYNHEPIASVAGFCDQAIKMRRLAALDVSHDETL